MSLTINNQLPDLSCTGCGACLQTCKVDAIKMETQADGFIYPRIDSAKCVQCGQCVKVCHALDNSVLKASSICYAAQISRKDILRISTSGGLFYALAQSILSENGVVYGCTYDDNYNAVIERADTFDKISQMHGSKYVWSDSSLSYPSVDFVCTGNDKKMNIFITDNSLKDQIIPFISSKTNLHNSAFRVWVVNEIPRNDYGKVQFNVLEKITES